MAGSSPAMTVDAGSAASLPGRGPNARPSLLVNRTKGSGPDACRRQLGYDRAMADATPVFGPFSLDRSGKVLLRDGTPVDIGQRGIALLKALIEARGSTVTKAELLELAWPD